MRGTVENQSVDRSLLCQSGLTLCYHTHVRQGRVHPVSPLLSVFRLYMQMITKVEVLFHQRLVSCLYQVDTYINLLQCI